MDPLMQASSFWEKCFSGDVFLLLLVVFLASDLDRFVLDLYFSEFIQKKIMLILWSKQNIYLKPSRTAEVLANSICQAVVM